MGLGAGDPVNFSDPFGLCKNVKGEQVPESKCSNPVDKPLEAPLVDPVELAASFMAPGVASLGEAVFTRFGSGTAESVGRLAGQSAAAETQIGIHGVSVRLGSGFKREGATATREALEEAGFTLEKTGGDPKHFTAGVPKSVTQKVADAWNKVWGWLKD